MHTDEEKKKLGRETLDTLRDMFKRWIKSDVNWALEVINSGKSNGEEGEWDFLRDDWMEKLTQWMAPYISRLKSTGYITEKDIETFGEEAAETMEIMLNALYSLGGNKSDE